MAQAPPSLAVGTRLSHYEILGLVGAGGMGEVYRARDTRLHRHVALKILPAATAANPERRHRFEREARVVAALNHPNIVTIHSVDDVDGRLFLTMELVDGRPLSDLLRAGGLPVERILAIAVPLADAVSAAHARGITHRDLKPANVMVTRSGQVKVLDFGLAKLFDTGATDNQSTETPDLITSHGRILGTIAYMSPEQARGKEVDARSDIFSLGVMLYELATGERPFKGDTTVSTLAAITRDTPKSVTEVNPAVPRELARVIRRALSKDPERRQQSGKELRNDLEELRDDLASGQLGVGTGQAASGTHGPAPRRVPGAVLVGALVLAAATGAGVLWWRRGPVSTTPAAADPPVQVTVMPLTAEDGIEMFPSLSPDGKWAVYERDADGSGNGDILLRAVGGQATINLTKDSAFDDSQPVFSPDGERIAFRSERGGGGLFVMGRTGESVRRLTTDGFNPSWSPDGASIVYATRPVVDSPNTRDAGSELWVASTATGERRQLTTADGVQPAWSPHGQRIAYWGITGDSAQRDLWTVAVTAGEPVRVTQDAAIDWSPAWGPDGRHLYFSSNRSGGFNLWRVAIDESTGRPLGAPVALPIPWRGIGHLSLSADGTAVAMASITFQTSIEAVTFDPIRGTAGVRRRVLNSFDVSGSPAVSRDGDRLAFFKQLENGQEDLWIAKKDGSEARQLTDDPAHDRGPRWSPDGTGLMFYSDRSGRYQVWTIAADGGGLMQVTDYPAQITQPVWSPDGTRAMATTPLPDAKLLLFDPRLPAARQAIEELPRSSEGFAPTSWSPDGARVAGHGNRRPEGGILVYDVAARTYTELAPAGAFPAWLPDNRRLIFTGAANGELTLLDTATRATRRIVSGPEAFGDVGLSPGAREIYVNVYKVLSDIVVARLGGTP